MVGRKSQVILARTFIISSRFRFVLLSSVVTLDAASSTRFFLASCHLKPVLFVIVVLASLKQQEVVNSTLLLDSVDRFSGGQCFRSSDPLSSFTRVDVT
jgi:hypothetical protein